MEKIPRGLIWTQELAAKAALNVKFIRVSSNMNKTVMRIISGAQNSWLNYDPEEYETIFDTSYRITGTPDNIIKSLRYAGIPDENIQEVLDNAITKDNYLTNPEYTEEINRHKIFNEIRAKGIKYTPIEKAVVLNFPWIVKEMIENNQIDPRENNNHLYQLAVDMDNQEIAEYLKDEIIKRNWYEKHAYQSMFTPLRGSGTDYEDIIRHTRDMY